VFYHEFAEIIARRATMGIPDPAVGEGLPYFGCGLAQNGLIRDFLALL
jgi:hypothetical protein